MAGRARKEKPKKVNQPAHPPANNIIVAHIDGEEYKAYVTHFELIYDEFLNRQTVAWQLKFSYQIAKKRHLGIIAGWERKPFDTFLIEILPIKHNKYQQNKTYTGKARFNIVEEEPGLAHITLDIISNAGIKKML
jgi:hypothetical protein